jgi:O-antigen/teichoic acid export membrane protein
MIKKLRNNKFAWNSLVLFTGTMIANVLNYIFHLVVGRMVSIEMYGEIESLISLSHIISVPALTLAIIATKYSAENKADNNPAGSRSIFRFMNKKVFVYGAPLFLIALFITPLVKEFLKIDNGLAIFFVWITMFIAFFSSVNSGILTGWQKFKDISIVGILGTLIKLISAVVFIKIGFALSGVIGAFLLAAIATYVGFLFVLKFIFVGEKEKNNKKQKPVDFSSMKRYVLPAAIGTLAITLLGNIDMVLAKHQLDPTMSGQYGALNIMSKAIFFATGVIATVLFSMSAEENYSKGDSWGSLKKATALTFLVTFLATAFYFLFPKFVIDVFFGEKYYAVAQYLGLFAIVASLYAFVNLFIQYLLSIKKIKYIWVFLVIAVLEIIAIFFFGLNVYAILLIVLLTQAVAILVGILFIYLTRKESRIKNQELRKSN